LQALFNMVGELTGEGPGLAPYARRLRWQGALCICESLSLVALYARRTAWGGAGPRSRQPGRNPFEPAHGRARTCAVLRWPLERRQSRRALHWCSLPQIRPAV